MRMLIGIISATTCNGVRTPQRESLVYSDGGFRQRMLLNTVNTLLFGRGWHDDSCGPIG